MDKVAPRLVLICVVACTSSSAVDRHNDPVPPASSQLGFKSIWFIHMRKSAGTSFRDYARRLALVRPLECGGVAEWRRAVNSCNCCCLRCA